MFGGSLPARFRFSALVPRRLKSPGLQGSVGWGPNLGPGRPLAGLQCRTACQCTSRALRLAFFDISKAVDFQVISLAFDGQIFLIVSEMIYLISIWPGEHGQLRTFLAEPWPLSRV